MNENEIIKAETSFYYVNFVVYFSVAVRPRARVITHKHESHQFDQLQENSWSINLALIRLLHDMQLMPVLSHMPCRVTDQYDKWKIIDGVLGIGRKWLEMDNNETKADKCSKTLKFVQNLNETCSKTSDIKLYFMSAISIGKFRIVSNNLSDQSPSILLLRFTGSYYEIHFCFMHGFSIA